MKGELALLLKALAFAAHKHRDQRRKDADASPYINHPIALADVLVNEGGVTDTEVLCAALLHDTVEDTATTHEELVDAFGSRIARIVAEVTDDQDLPKADRKRHRPWTPQPLPAQMRHIAACRPRPIAGAEPRPSPSHGSLLCQDAVRRGVLGCALGGSGKWLVRRAGAGM